MTTTGFMSVTVEIGFALVMLSILLSLIRLAVGPSLADRVVALDMMTVSIVAFCALFSIETGSPVFLDVAIVLALVGFMSTVALARYAERSLKRQGPHPKVGSDPFLNTKTFPPTPGEDTPDD